MEENEKFYREKLHDKLQKQFNSYKANLINESKDSLIRDAYEITIKAEIVDLFIPLEWDFSLEEIKGLLHRKNVLEDLYHDWMKEDTGIHLVIKDSLKYKVEQYANEYKKNIKENKLKDSIR